MRQDLSELTNQYSDVNEYLMHMVQLGTVKYHELIDELCQPLFKHFNITGFRTIAYSYSGNFFFYGNRPEFAKRFIEEKLYLKYRDIPWPKYDTLLLPIAKLNTFSDNKSYDVKKWLNEDYALCMCENTEYGREQFWFSGHSDAGVKNTFQNDRSSLREFTHYFQKESKQVRDELIALKYSIYDFSMDKNKNIVLENDCVEESDTPFSKQDKHNTISFLHDIGVFNKIVADHKLSKREQEILHLTSKGKTAKEVALLLHISNKTVEYHLENSKKKLNANNKLELISIFSVIKYFGFEWITKKLGNLT